MRLPIYLVTAVLASLTSTTVDARPPTIDCHPRAWVRAPDLTPGTTTPAQARLTLNGTECPALESWSVGLRMKERAIFKFHAANVTMPTRPMMQDLETDDDEDTEPFVPGDIFQTHSVRGRTRRHEAFRLKMREYEDALAARSLWTSRSATREVFDSALPLPVDPTNRDPAGTRTTWLADFRVNVPSTNYPYEIVRNMHFSGGDPRDVSSVESMFEYYLLVTYVDGTVLDIPAGKTAFIPASSVVGTRGEGRTEGREVVMVDSKREQRGHQGPPECDRGLVSGFSITVDLPADTTLVAGTTHILNVTIHQTGNSTQIPTRISASMTTCTRDTWAASYAFESGHKRETTTCVGDLEDEEEGTEWQWRRGPFFMRDVEDRVLMTRREEGYGAAQRQERVREVWMDSVMGQAPIGPPTDLKGFVRSKTVQVNLTIPDDVAFTYNRTLQNSENRLYIHLQTEYACQATAGTDVGDEVTDDELWATWWRESLTRAGKKHQGNWFGQIKVTVAPPAGREWTSDAPLMDYKDVEAKAIVLTTLDAPQVAEDEYPFVHVEVVESETDLQTEKYAVWPRLPLCPEFKTRGHCEHGLGQGLVGELWARYQWRKEQRKGNVLKQESQVILQ